jgi:hypothetical protein
MPTLGIDAIAVGYTLVAALLLGLLIPARLAWQAKAGAIAIGTALCIATWASLPALLGWPTEADLLPEEFNLVSGYIVHPDPLTRTEGAIYLWGTERKEGARSGTPRAYVFPYSVELGTRVDEAGNKLRKNVAQAGRIEDDENLPDGRATGERRRGQKSVNIEFYDVPAPSLPDK